MFDLRYKVRFPRPCPDFAPEEVVKIQLDALQNNDILGGDEGVRAAFHFASPANRLFTGPVERFIEMIKSPLYSRLIGFSYAEMDLMVISGSLAQQRVRVMRPGGVSNMYLFTLTRQNEAPYMGCWMTDSVLLLE
jgi:hypothetical protein